MMKIHVFCVFVILLCVLIFATRSGDAATKRIIINTDAGADDAIAITLALAYEASHSDKIKVVGIICSYGNTYREHVEQNVLKTMTVSRRSDIPIYSGATGPILPGYSASKYYGSDGFGDFEFDEEITASMIRTKHGIEALIDLVKQYNDVHIISLAPLTNIALAMKLDDDFLNRVREIHIMGGSVNGRGNTRPNVEYNFALDPESNYIVLNGTRASMSFLYPWETILDNSISKEWRTDVLGKKKSSTVNFLNKAERISLEMETSWIPADVYTMAGVIWPELITDTLSVNVNAVIDGAAKGSLLVDYGNSTGKPDTTTIMRNFNVTKLKELLLQYLS